MPAVRVEADPQKLAAYGLNIDDLRTLLGNINVSQPKGNFDGPDLDYTINDNDQIQDPKDYLNTVIAYQNGAPVFMRDVAHGHARPRRTSSRAPGSTRTPAIVLNVQRQPGANVIATVDQIKKQLPQLLASLPQAMHVRDRRRQHRRDPLLGVRRRLRAGAGDRAGGAGDLRVPAQRAGDHHPEHFRAGVADRHAGGDVPAATTRSTICR